MYIKFEKSLMIIRIHNRLPRVHTLGPGCRYAVWVQGCTRHCAGCLAPETWNPSAGETIAVNQLAHEICSTKGIEGVTISGGEPFEQAEAICALLQMILARRELSIVVYTGYCIEELLESKSRYKSGLLSHIDVLIDGPYINEEDDGLSLRGSSNQRVHCLTEKYAGIIDKHYGRRGRRVELFPGKESISYAGIPSSDFKKVWNTNLKGGKQ